MHRSPMAGARQAVVSGARPGLHTRFSPVHLVGGSCLSDTRMEGLERNASLSWKIGHGRLGYNKGPGELKCRMEDGEDPPELLALLGGFRSMALPGTPLHPGLAPFLSQCTELPLKGNCMF